MVGEKYRGFMQRRIRQSLATILLLAGIPVSHAADLSDKHARDMAAGLELFKATVGPALREHCLDCHGGEKTRADLDVSSREALLRGFTDGPALVPGDSNGSLLLKLIRHEEEPAMPHKEDKLPDALINQIARWIDLGAPYDKPLIEKSHSDGKGPLVVSDKDREFWSFRPLLPVELPAVAKGAQIRNPIDRFVSARLAKNGITGNREANRRTLMRRVYLDLIGMPPTPEEAEAFLNDNRPNAYGELVDRLLKDPRYGERWARHWLDAARFAESHGFEQDYDRKHAYHYRDFVIKALNADMPYDQFVKWQLAGDEFAPDDPLAMMATGFLGAGVFPTQLTEKEFESARYDELDDMVSTMGAAMLGLSIGCARCHDHKFDPVPMRDYYRLVSTFATTIRSEIDLELDAVGNARRLAEWKKKHAAAEAALATFEKEKLPGAFSRWAENPPAEAESTSVWILPGGIEAASKRGATFSAQSDGSFLVGGKNPKDDEWVVRAKAPTGTLKALRVEALTHDSMKRKGPGRAGNGNFALSDIRVFREAAGGDRKQRVRIKLVNPRATHEQNKGALSVASSLDADKKKSGWAVDYGGIGKDQAAVFEFAEPIEFKSGESLVLEMDFFVNTSHTIGRPRFSVTREASPAPLDGEAKPDTGAGLIAELKKAGSLAALADDKRAQLLEYYKARNDAWVKLDAKVRKSLAAKPEPQRVKVQVTSEGFKPTKHHADGRGFPHFYEKTYFLNRGDVNQKRDEVSQGFLQALMREGVDEKRWQVGAPKAWRTSYRRRSLANWMTDTESGAGALLARVAVNRLWHHHFGRGIVSTPNDFGFQGERPTHPELLEHLAQELIANGWRLKGLHKQILLSAAYRRGGEFNSASAKIDPENRLLWRRTPRRLEAEALRDSMLAVGGVLDRTMFGPGTLDPNHKRRSIYFMIKRSRLIPMMQVFDAPEPLVSQGSRPSTTIAPQALTFMNSPQVRVYAEGMATRLPAEGGIAEAVKQGFQIALSRGPGESELKENLAFIQAQLRSYERDGVQDARKVALADFCQILMSLNEFAYVE